VGHHLWRLLLSLTAACGLGALCTALLLAALGVSGLGAAVVTQWTTPRAQEVVVPVYFDYSQGPELTADAWLLPKSFQSTSKPGRMHKRGQAMDVWMTAVMPQTEQNCRVFQVEAHLLTATNASVAVAHRPAMLHCPSLAAHILQTLLALPYLFLGLRHEERTLEVPLFTNHKESPHEPVASARVILKGRAGGGALPEFYSVNVHVHLRLGILSQLLYTLRRHSIPFAALLATALATLGAGLTCGCCAVATLLLVRVSGNAAAGSAPPPRAPPSAGAYVPPRRRGGGFGGDRGSGDDNGSSSGGRESSGSGAADGSDDADVSDEPTATEARYGEGVGDDRWSVSRQRAGIRARSGSRARRVN